MDRIDSPEHAQPPHPLIGTTVGPYEILESIGIGAIGMVLKARLVNTEEFVALKLLPFDIDSTTIKRLEREAKVLAQLQHPHIVQVFDIRATPTKQHFIVIEYIEGENLKEIIERDVVLDVHRAMPIFHQIADGMAFAHGKGVLHRDLKPHNIMLTNKPAPDFAKILDFGLAKLTQDSQELTRTGEILGSPVYMSPEQSQGTELDERSDIYSFGVLMYQTLTGSAPIRGSSAAETFALKLTKRPPPFIEVAPGLLVPDELETLVMRCLEVNPDRRISSMRQVKTELENIERRVRDITSDATGQTPQLRLSTRETSVDSFLHSKPVVVDDDGEMPPDDRPPRPYVRSRVDAVDTKRKLMVRNIVMLVAVTLFATGVAATVGVTYLNKQAKESADTDTAPQSDSATTSDTDAGADSRPTASKAAESDSNGFDESDSDETATTADKTARTSSSDDETDTKKAALSGGMSGGGTSTSTSKSGGGLSGHSGMSDSSDRMPAPPSGVSVTESIPLTPKGMSALYQPKSDGKKVQTHAPTAPPETESAASKSSPVQAAPSQISSVTKPPAPPKSAPPELKAKPAVEVKPVVADDSSDSLPARSTSSEKTAALKKASKPKPRAKPRPKKKAAPKPAVAAEAEPAQPRVRRAYSTWQYYQERTRQGR